jgi:hypothetical protein
MTSDPTRKMLPQKAALVARWGTVALVVMTIARPAVGEETAENRDAVQRLIADAVAEYDAGRFEEARALFRTAQNQLPSARTLRGIGMASFELRDYVEASRTLTASLKEQRRALTPDQRRHVNGLLARAETFVGRFAVRLAPPDSSLFVDEKPAEREPDGALLLPFGRHRIIARCPTCAETERVIQVLGGERQDLVIALEPVTVTVQATGQGTGQGLEGAPAAADVASHARGVSDQPSVSVQPIRARSSVGAAAVVGGAAVLVAAGAVASALWWRDRARELDVCRAVANRCQNQAAVEGERNTAAGVTLGLTATAVTAGIVAAVLWSRRGPAQTQTLACFAVGKGASCAMSF